MADSDFGGRPDFSDRFERLPHRPEHLAGRAIRHSHDSGGVALPPRPLTAIALMCAIFRMLFDSPDSGVEAILRFAFAFLAYTSVGLFVSTLLKNQRQAVEHLQGMKREQSLRAQAEDQLKALVESSPAAILTLDDHGKVLAANNSAANLFGYASAAAMAGISIEPHLPVLREALLLDTAGDSFRTAAQSRARRLDGNLFLADMWFSTYGGPDRKRLAAIIVDSSEEMREREEQNLRQLSAGSSILASAVLHEVRNLCSAFSVVSANLKLREQPCRISDLQPLDSLVNGLARITSFELQRKEPANLESVSVCRLLDELRIIIEPSWSEADGHVRWICRSEARARRRRGTHCSRYSSTSRRTACGRSRTARYGN